MEAETGVDVASPLDQLLTQATHGTLRRLTPFGPGLRMGLAACRRPQRVLTRASDLVTELGRVVTGSSDISPSKRDRRFADAAWTGNPVLRRIVQSYLAFSREAEGLVQDLPASIRDAEAVRFAVSNLVEALSPSNNPLLSPLAWKAVIDTGGANLVDGPRHLIGDLSRPPRVPSMVDTTAYEVGRDLATSTGAVVVRTPRYELIQYQPTTETVRTVPVLVIPPTINKYYVLDLAPGRSLVEHLVREGQQVFLLSWRNPDARHSKWGVDDYAGSILEAMDEVNDLCGTSSTHVLAACSGGLLSSIAAASRAAEDRLDSFASLSLLVTMIDQRDGGTVSALVDERSATAATAKSRRKGYLDGRSLAEVFAWLRPSDLIWNYWVNNYLQGKTPPRFDILYWNADTTRMTSRLHADFVDISMDNKLARAGGATALGTEIDLGRIDVDSYVVAGSADHICPWVNCYRSAQLLGGKVRFVLSTNGHVAALVNPPGNPKSSYQVADDTGPAAEDWRRQATTVSGSWWPDLSRWLGERSGEDRPAPSELGDARHRPLGPAPGSYIHDR